MRTKSSFVDYLLGNLRTSGIAVGIALTLLAIYAQITDGRLMWGLVVIVAVGMAVSSIANALYDSRKKPKGREKE